MANRIEVKTSQYVFAHGHAPRGRGLWVFEVFASDGETICYSYCFNGSYSDAKADVVSWAKKQPHAATVVVGS